ncbi:MAG: hypothetical protein PVG65_00420 [Candidatus Thorarchaeota archaeon]|jgi:hypothetical protein
MEILLKKTRINKSQLKRLITKFSAGELSNLSEPCYRSPLKSQYFQLLHACKLTDRDIKEFRKRLYAKHPAKNWKTHNVAATNLLLFIMYYFIKSNEKKLFSMTILYLLVRYYSNLMYSRIPYCNEDTFRYTLETLTKTHLFVREKTISNGIYHLSKELEKRWGRYIRDLDVDGIAKFVTEARSRMSQSTKSFVRNYYKSHKEGGSIKTQNEPSDEEEHSLFQYRVFERGRKSIDETVKRITIYKIVDKKAIQDAKKLTKIKSSVAVTISSSLTDLKYGDSIRTILQLFIKDLKDARSLCGSGYIPYVKKLMELKRTRSKIYFKQQVNILLEKVLEDIKYKDWYNKLTSQTKFIVKSYLAFYLTMVFRNSIC